MRTMAILDESVDQNCLSTILLPGTCRQWCIPGLSLPWEGHLV